MSAEAWRKNSVKRRSKIFQRANEIYQVNISRNNFNLPYILREVLKAQRELELIRTQRFLV